MSKFDVLLQTGPGFRLVHELTGISQRVGSVNGRYHYKDGTTWRADHHFESMPIMPGVRQLSLMKETACQCFIDPYPVDLITIKDAKFSGKIKSGANLIISAVARQNPDDAEVLCELKINEKVITTATFIFAKKIVRNFEPVIMPFDYLGREIWTSENGFMPPEMVIECLAENMTQIVHVLPELNEKVFIFCGVQKAEFGRDIHPDSTIDLISMIDWTDKGRRGTVTGVAMVNQEVVTRAIIEFACFPRRKNDYI